MTTQNWAEEELQSIDLGDQRLNKRLIQLTESFSQSPQSPINHACEDWAETKGAYRFFSNENVDYKDILQGHIQSTAKRCLGYPTILASQDTTYFNYTSHTKTEGLSILTTKKAFNKTQRRLTKGLIMHSSLAVSTDGLPLGVLDQKTYCHEERHVERKIRKAQNDLLPIEEKESFRWLESLQNTKDTLLDEKITVVTVCDREADIYDFFLLSHKIQSPVLVRAKSNRIINKKTAYSKKTGEKLWSFMKKQSCQGSIQVKIPKKEKIPSRLATLEIRFCEFILNPPFNHPKLKKEKLPPLRLNAVYVKEINNSDDVDPIDWMLVTNLPVTNFDEAVEKIKWYSFRWRIEVFHKILKSGLKVEDCRLSTAERLIRYLSVMSIVAWRIFWLTLVARVAPQASCYLFLNDLEWKILFSKINKKCKIPKDPPTVKECIVWIARLGGFLARKGDKDPGITHIWRGLNKFTNLLEGAELGELFVGNK